MGKDYDPYWIKEGIKVIHIDLLADGPTMTVDEVVRVGSKIKGVDCHWIDKEHQYQTGRFHTRELVKKSDATI